MTHVFWSRVPKPGALLQSTDFKRTGAHQECSFLPSGVWQVPVSREYPDGHSSSSLTLRNVACLSNTFDIIYLSITFEAISSYSSFSRCSQIIRVIANVSGP